MHAKFRVGARMGREAPPQDLESDEKSEYPIL